ncbi:hypothetical protein NP590_01105 [Methylomonas sp. SURF-2]|uniref:Uncharacterized protein n=1 Tax=Methylomonas subterranea TaxID=2952225 RepID=A0ABT1TB47_9GAMM|nr:hypothetical protein [Methylomonas sp. SURF-2]MCQ8102686.1 hypothetical protein [Methylomonas sp. SURF-2]
MLTIAKKPKANTAEWRLNRSSSACRILAKCIKCLGARVKSRKNRLMKVEYARRKALRAMSLFEFNNDKCFEYCEGEIMVERKLIKWRYSVDAPSSVGACYRVNVGTSYQLPQFSAPYRVGTTIRPTGWKASYSPTAKLSLPTPC